MTGTTKKLQLTTDEQRAIYNAWIELKATTTVKDFTEKQGISPASLYNYVRKFGEGKVKGKPTAKAAPAPTTLAGMRAELALQQEALEKRKADYKKLLEGEIVRLKGELEKAELELLEYEEEFQVLDAATDQANQN
jgi:hypothetical protein